MKNNDSIYASLSYEKLENESAREAFKQLRQAIAQDESIEKVEILTERLKSIGKDLKINLFDVRYGEPRLLLGCTSVCEETLLYQVSCKARLDATLALLKAGADPAMGSFNGANALNNITSPYMRERWHFPKEGLEDIIYTMVKKNPSVLEGQYRAHGGIGNMPLHDMINAQEWNLVQFFIEKGAKLDIAGQDGLTARELLENVSCPESILTLIEKLDTAPRPIG